MARGSAEPMVWPNTAQYKRALQRPDLAFTDPELKAARLDRDMMGTPASVEGQSAVVFFGETDDGKVTVRCLKRPVAYGERRYAALHSYLAERLETPLAAVEWQSNGVSVDGRQWPIVKMEHVDGSSMRQYVSRYLHVSADLHVLSNRWHELAAELRRHKIAHGDLQQDNVRIVDERSLRLRLIDLDEVWAPPLASMPPRECGHRHFQHPERLRTGHWDAAVDTFSALVIYVSLRALAADPSLWEQYHNDENLILADLDFENPGRTPIWSQLAASRDLDVRRLALILEQFCKQTVWIESDLETILRTGTLPGGAVYMVSGVPLQRATWWADASDNTIGAEPSEGAPLWPGTADAQPVPPDFSHEPATPVGGESTSVMDRWPYSMSAPATQQRTSAPTGPTGVAPRHVARRILGKLAAIRPQRKSTPTRPTGVSRGHVPRRILAILVLILLVFVLISLV
jgi:eukaryotic-like serine/threonine-protein kinase